ncbi:hypothetical protein HmCmsJML041_01090 [Escherichia coli]|nr:hypothetical protein HmCmsJML006_03982 [Escherichia coli]GCU79119.1 hypothetical protein HmCmsJML031_00947 [Escherichia coli]GCV11384.1 hypothetical protein HmCmsJML025_02595 [Escherichia coli]GCV48350.1 hypothetical protein HmCmsJML041_01090 [Escherichia coli]GCV86828.1 hypothetical protein HmCmsJML049_02190 [Escherichia coli]
MSLILLLIANCKSEGFELVLSLLISFGGIASTLIRKTDSLSVGNKSSVFSIFN